MKRLSAAALYFFALSLLLFAAYLNFFRTDTEAPSPSHSKTTAGRAKGTVLVSDPEQYLKGSDKENESDARRTK